MLGKCIHNANVCLIMREFSLFLCLFQSTEHNTLDQAVEAWKIARDDRKKRFRCHSVEHDNDFIYLFSLLSPRCTFVGNIFLRLFSTSHYGYFFSCTFTELFTSFFLPSLAVFCCSYLAFTPIIISKKSYNFLTPCRACKLHFAYRLQVHVNSLIIFLRKKLKSFFRQFCTKSFASDFHRTARSRKILIGKKSGKKIRAAQPYTSRLLQCRSTTEAFCMNEKRISRMKILCSSD